MRGILSGVLLLAGCGGPEEGKVVPWTPDGGTTGLDVDPHDTRGTGQSDPDPGSEGSDTEACEPGESGECLCPDGLHLGTQSCAPDGSAWGECVCDDDGGTTGTGGDEADAGEEEDGSSGGGVPSEVCYMGSDRAYTTCFDLVIPDGTPDGYDYPAALNGDANYREPVAYLDLEAADPATMVSPNFRLDELAQLYKGQWAVVQPHAVDSLQELRDAVGGIGVNSAYRSPDYNAGVGGATHSRHMYGDGFDLDPVSVGLSTLEAECVDIGGMLVEYESHVHCDFRFDDVDVGFFGAAGAPSPPSPLRMSARIEHDAGVFTAPALGFDEGQPTRRWVAYDAADHVLGRALTPVFVAPSGTARVTVDVGRRVQLERRLVRR